MKIAVWSLSPRRCPLSSVPDFPAQDVMHDIGACSMTTSDVSMENSSGFAMGCLSHLFSDSSHLLNSGETSQPNRQRATCFE